MNLGNAYYMFRNSSKYDYVIKSMHVPINKFYFQNKRLYLSNF